MEFILTEEYDNAMTDCLNLIEKNPDATRDECIGQPSYPEAPPPTKSSISNMLDDEAADNLLSSVALEKNVFSDDDEFALKSLKKPNKTIEGFTMEMDLDTDELMNTDPDMGYDLVNFPPPSPREEAEQDSSLMKHADEPCMSPKENGDMDQPQEEILFEITTDSVPVVKMEMEVSDSMMEDQGEGNLSKDPDDDDCIIQEALNDHNYISPKINFKIVASYVINDMIPTEESCLLDLLASRRSNGATFLENMKIKEAVSDSDDDSVASNETIRFPHKGNIGNDRAEIPAEKDAEVDDEDEDDNQSEFSCDIPYQTVCKEELVIDDQPSQNVSGELSETIEEKTEDKEEQDSVEEKSDDKEEEDSLKEKSDDKEEIEEENSVEGKSEGQAQEDEHEDKTEVNVEEDVPTEQNCESDAATAAEKDPSSPPPPQNNPQSSTESGSTPSVLFSENRSEPNEFYDSEMHTSDSEVDDKSKVIASLIVPTEEQADEMTESHLSEADKTKLAELKNFANRLLEFCKKPDPNTSLDTVMDQLLVDFKSILCKSAYADMSTQTERIISKEKRAKMNERAKRRLLNPSSSSSDYSSSEFDYDDEMDVIPPKTPVSSNVNEPNDTVDEVEAEENAPDEEKLEKSPSYSDLSAAGSEEFLNTEADELETRSNCDGVDLSKYTHSNVGESEDLDLSKYEVRSEKMSQENLPSQNEEEIQSACEERGDEVAMDESNKENENVVEDNPTEIPIAAPDAVVDEEMPEISVAAEKADDADDASDIEDADIESNRKSIKDIIESDDKLQAEAVVAVTKLSDEDLEDYYDDLRDKEIQKLLKFSGIKKLRLIDPDAPGPSDKPTPVYRSKATKKLLDVLKEVENDLGSDDSNSEVEETEMTEKDFLRMCNEKAKLEILKSSSSDSELESLVSDSEVLKALESSSDDEDGPSMIDKFLEKFSADMDNDDGGVEGAEDDEQDADADDDDAEADDDETGISEAGPSKAVETDGEDADIEDAADAVEPDAVGADAERMETEGPIEKDAQVVESTTDVEANEEANKQDETTEGADAPTVDDNETTPNVTEKDKNNEVPPVIDITKTEVISTDKPSTADRSPSGMSDDVVILDADSPKPSLDDSNEKDKSDSESRSTVSTVSKPSTSRGLPRSLRNLLLEEKEIDLDAIERSTPTNANDAEDDLDDIFDKATHRPASNKSLETLIEESRRRQNSRSTDNIVTLDSDSELEEVPVEPEQPKRSIKPMLRKDQLAGETRTAQRRENERIRRLEKKNEKLASALSDSQGTERELVLDYNSETKEFIKVHPEIVKHLKEHQFEGIKFMYDNTYGSVETLQRNPGSGCILAHCMGLGKTLQIVALLHTVINNKELDTCRILVLCPKSTVMNWADEIKRWLGPLKVGLPKIYSFFDHVSNSIQDKLKILHEWSQCGKPGFRKSGILLLGYEAFRTLVLNPLNRRKQMTIGGLDKIKQKISDALLDPGADLVICDEGHIIKNRKSATSTAVSLIRTPRRIILTGTPIQNNLKEYYAMVNFIKPKFLGTEKEFANLYENPIRNGQHKDSGKHDIKIMKQRSFVLHKKLSKFVQRREAALLQQFLPAKFEYVLFVPMTEVQINLYEFFLQESSKREGSQGKNLIPDYTCLRKIWTHPRVLENAWKNAMHKKREPKRSPMREPNSDDEQPDDVYDTQTGKLSVTDDWWRSLLSEDNLKSILPSNKLQVMFEILRMCEENGEKCLIFSAFVAVLDCVEYFMNEITKQSETARQYGLLKYRGPWISGKDYYRLDGKTPKNIRHEMVKSFNNPQFQRARVFLISAKAGGQGINLIGANRVIILDTSWNPSNDQQNIFRVFRLGQKRQCYVYRLLAMGTMEEKVYSRAVTKQAMSFRVVDEQQIDRHYSMAELAELYTLTKPDYDNRPVPALPQDGILASLLRNTPHLVYKYHEHDSLLENRSEQELSEQEKNDAWEAYERDLQTSQNPDYLAAGLNNMPHLYQNPGGFPPGMGYGYPQDRNFPMGYPGNMPQRFYPPSAFPGSRAFLDMLQMFSGAPHPNGPNMMSLLNSNPAGNPPNSMNPYGAVPSTSSAPSPTSMPMNLPPFSSLQNIASNPGASSFHNDLTFLQLSQMYASAAGYADSRNGPGRPTSSSPNNNGTLDKRNPPFPTGLLPPTSSADGIPTSVIQPPYNTSSPAGARMPMPSSSSSVPSLAQQLAQLPVGPPPAYGKPGSSNHMTLQQQLLAQPRLPPPGIMQGLQSLMQQQIPTSQTLSNDMTITKSTAVTKSPTMPTSSSHSSPSVTSAVTATSANSSPITTVPSQRNSPKTSSKPWENNPVTVDITPLRNQLMKSAYQRNSPMNTTPRGSPVSGTPRNNSPVTTPSRAQSKTSNSSRATNMGIVYPPENSTTITPIPTTSTAASPPSGISVRSVSSINSASSKNTIPATIIPKPGVAIPTHLTNMTKNPNAASNNAASAGTATLTPPISLTNISKQPNTPNRSVNTSDKTKKSTHASLISQIRAQQQLTAEKKDKGKAILPSGLMNKTALQILGSNNVQLTKVPNTRSVLAQSQNNVGNKPKTSLSTLFKGGAQTQAASSPSSVITKARSNSELTLLPVGNSPNTNSAKTPTPNKSATVVPTLVPFGSKAMTITPANRPTVVTNTRASLPTSNANSPSAGALNAKPPNSLLATNKKAPMNVNRVNVSKAFPVDMISSGQTGVKRAISYPNLQGAKQARSVPNNAQVSRPSTSSALSNAQQQGRPHVQSAAANSKSSPSPNVTAKNAMHIRSLDTTNNNKNNTMNPRSMETINRFSNAGITISSGKGRANVATSNQNVLTNQGNNSIKSGNSSTTPNVNNIGSGVVLSKVGQAVARKRPAPPSAVTGHSSSAVDQLKRPRITPVVDRTVVESLSRARTNQGLTISMKNAQGNQRTKNDGKVTEIVEID